MFNRYTLMNYNAAIVLEILDEWSSFVERKFSDTPSHNNNSTYDYFRLFQISSHPPLQQPAQTLRSLGG